MGVQPDLCIPRMPDEETPKGAGFNVSVPTRPMLDQGSGLRSDLEEARRQYRRAAPERLGLELAYARKLATQRREELAEALELLAQAEESLIETTREAAGGPSMVLVADGGSRSDPKILVPTTWSVPSATIDTDDPWTGVSDAKERLAEARAATEHAERNQARLETDLERTAVLRQQAIRLECALESRKTGPGLARKTLSESRRVQVLAGRIQRTSEMLARHAADLEAQGTPLSRVDRGRLEGAARSLHAARGEHTIAVRASDLAETCIATGDKSLVPGALSASERARREVEVLLRPAENVLGR